MLLFILGALIDSLSDLDSSFFLVTVDLWSWNGKNEMNLVLHPSAADRYVPSSTPAKQRRREKSTTAPTTRTSSQGSRSADPVSSLILSILTPSSDHPPSRPPAPLPRSFPPIMSAQDTPFRPRPYQTRSPLRTCTSTPLQARRLRRGDTPRNRPPSIATPLSRPPSSRPYTPSVAVTQPRQPLTPGTQIATPTARGIPPPPTAPHPSPTPGPLLSTPPCAAPLHPTHARAQAQRGRCTITSRPPPRPRRTPRR